MERYEVRVKFEEIKRLAGLGNYQAALEVADQVDWDRVKNTGMLLDVGEIFERNRCYDESKAVYERAYKLQPQSRKTVRRLANVSVKLKDFGDARLYWEEFKEIAPYDPAVLEIEYKIKKGEEADYPELIAVLENLCHKDYHEKWAYELAVLYGVADDIDKCVRECDKIFLYFGEGKYVKKALKLKSAFRTLTSEQERYLRSTEPKNAQETIDRTEEAAKETEEKHDEFMKIQKEVEQFGETREEKLRDLEEAREQAINASREAKAGELLKEAELENQNEDSESDIPVLDDGSDTAIPEFPIKSFIDSSLKREQPVLKAENHEVIVPGTEFISVNEEPEAEEDSNELDIAYSEEIEIAYEKDIVKNIDPIEEARKRIHDIADNSDSDLLFEDYVIDDEPLGEIESEAGTEFFDKYASEEAAISLDEDEIEDPAEYLSNVINDSLNKHETDESAGAESNLSKIQNVINRIWVKPANKKPVREERSFDDNIDDIEIKTDVEDDYSDIDLQKEIGGDVNDAINESVNEELGKTKVVFDRNNPGRTDAVTVAKEKVELDYAMEMDLGDILSEETRRKIEECEIFDTFEQESDGQIKIVVEEVKKKETDIPGQLNLNDFINENKENEAKQVSDMRLYDNQKDLLAHVRRLMESPEPDSAEIDIVMQGLTLMLSQSNDKSGHELSHILDAEEMSEEENQEIVSEETDISVIEFAVEEEELPEISDIFEEPEDSVEIQSLEEELSGSVEVEAEEDIDNYESEAEEIAEDIEAEEEEITENAEIEEPELDLSDDLPEISLDISEETLEKMNEEKDKFMDSIADISAKEVDGVDKKKAEKQYIPMSYEQEEIMDYFMNVPEIEKQITDFIETQYDVFDNIIICGQTGSGRASLALRLYKAIRFNNNDLPNQTLKVDADALNRKSILKVYEKISSGIVIIEHAGLLNDVAAAELELAMKKYEGSIYTIIIGNPERIADLLSKHSGIKEMCKYEFTIPEYNQNQYVDFAKNYAYSYGYVLDEMAELALHTELAAIKTRNKLITLQDVKQIVNDAILNSEKSAKKLFKGMFAKNKDKDGNIILKEKDFMV